MPTQSKTAQRTTHPAKRKPAKAVDSDAGSPWEKTKKRRRKKMRQETNKAPGRLAGAAAVKRRLPLFENEILKSEGPITQKILEMRALNEVRERENWKKIPKLKTPICPTADDVVISGHGNYGSRKKRVVGDTVVPEGFEFVQLAPLGATLTVTAGCKLDAGQPIRKLGIISPITGEIAAHQPIVYKAGDLVPNLTLFSPFDETDPASDLPIVFRPDGPKGIYLERGAPDQSLDSLWERVEAHRQPGKIVRVYWSACSAMPDASEPLVDIDVEA